ncbi:MAG TPA: FAD-binding oxidoreductase [Candidatus Deferrimicrobiaceae bacterium]|nr:FAD-binding oxidoreductase [Candidatus Deferrimicrobiaceae bacterium]
MEKFKASFRGELLQPGSPGYESARKVYNAMIDRRPALIARCRDVADVIASVRFAGETGMITAVRGGGHNAGGLGICDDGLVIDLSAMNGVRVDPRAKTIRVEGGCTWGDVDHAGHAFGLATPAGIISTTGVGGLTLGGGLGHLTRKCGLTIDNLLAADMVLADGRWVTASPEENPDLFWAIRGGGGNFGIVTSFLFRGHPVHTVLAGPTLWELDQAPEVLQRYREYIQVAPEEISGFFLFLSVPPGPPFPEPLHHRKMCGVVWCYSGSPDRFEEIFRPVRRFPTPAFELVGPMPYPALQSMFDGLYPPGHQWYWKADFVNELSDEAVRLHVEHGSMLPTPQSTMHLYPINGAARRVGGNATAWSYREATWAEVIVGVDPDPANNERLVRWANAYWNALHPHSAGGAYVNFMMHDEGQERVKATYRGNYERLAKVKAMYDPENFFRVNQNIQPAGKKSSRSAA